jgi:choline dehydrogenase-like flavoprotein
MGGSMISTMAEVRQPLPFARSLGRRWAARRWGKDAKDFVRKNFRRAAGFYAAGQGMPTEENRVDLDPEVRDAWSIPVLRVTHRDHPMDVRTSNFFMNRMREILLAAGAIEELLPKEITPEQTEATIKNITWGGLSEHQAGGCRMGTDPRSSVVNKFCQAHDVDNLFVADGSPFPTIGGFNPCLTIQANAFRVADYIVRQWRGGGLHS